MNYKWVYGDGILELASGFAKGVHHFMLLEKAADELGKEPENYNGGIFSEDPFAGAQFDNCQITWQGKGNPPSADQIKYMIQEKLHRFADRESMILSRVEEERFAADVEDTEPEFNFSFLKHPHEDLYPPAFEGGDKITAKASRALKGHVLDALKDAGYADADKWIYFTIYGSGISYNWDEDGDFDIQMWVDVNKYNEAHPDDPTTSDDLVAEVRRIVQPVNFPSFSELGLTTKDEEGGEGRQLIQYYPKPGSGTEEENLASKPYACYDLETNKWLYHPKPLTPEFYGEHFLSIMQKAEDIAVQSEALLEELQRNTISYQFWSAMIKEEANPRYVEAMETTKANAEQEKEGVLTLFEGVFGGRAEAYSPEGEGINDERDLIQKLLEVWGVFQRLKHFARQALPWEEQELPKESAWPFRKNPSSLSPIEVEWWNLWYDLRLQGIPSVGYPPLDEAEAAQEADKSVESMRRDWGHHPQARYNELVQRQMNSWLKPNDSSGVFKEIPKESKWPWEKNDHVPTVADGAPLPEVPVNLTQPVKSVPPPPYKWWDFRADPTNQPPIGEKTRWLWTPTTGLHVWNPPAGEGEVYHDMYLWQLPNSQKEKKNQDTPSGYLLPDGGVFAYPNFAWEKWEHEVLQAIRAYQGVVKYVIDDFQDNPKTDSIFGRPFQSSMEKFADWSEIMENAQKLRNDGSVQITSNGAQHVEGTVASQEQPGVVYNTSFERQDPNSGAITTWQCDCPWGEVSWGRTRQWKKYEGRPCKHTLAMFWQSQAQPVAESLPENQAQPQQQLFNPAQLAPPPAPGGANMPTTPDTGVVPTAQPPTAAPPAPIPAMSNPTQPMPPGPGSPTVAIPGALSKVKRSKRKLEQKTSAFFNGQVIVSTKPLMGIDRDQVQQMVPVGSLGEVLFSDDQDTIAIFPTDNGILEPHLIRVQSDTADFKPSRAKTPFVRRRK